MDTRSKILASALSLFNETGVDQVSTHSIARLAGISQGNLTYHFSTKKKMINALYFELITKLDQLNEGLDPTHLNLLVFYQTLEATFSIHYQYRFLFLDFASLMRNSQEIYQHFQEMLPRKEQEFQFIIQIFKHMGYLRTDIPSTLYQLLFKHVSIVGNFWQTAAAVFGPEEGELRIKEYTWLTFSLLAPYFTDKGWLEYEEIRQSESPSHSL